MSTRGAGPAYAGPSTPSAAGGPVAAPAIRGSIWTLGGYGASQILRLAGNLVLTRLLFPEVFGQMALVFIFIQGLAMFSDVGTGPAIIQNARGDDPNFLNTAWTVQVARGVVLWAASWAIAWPVAALYGQPELRWLIPAAGLTALLGGFESTAMHQLQRHLRLERITIADFGSQLVGVVATVLLAIGNRWLHGVNDPRAVWAILGGSLVSSATRLVLSHAYLPGIRNRIHLEREAAHHLFRFGRWIFVSTVLTFFAGQSDRLLFGKMIPMALLGMYSIAFMLATLPTQAILKLGGSVVFPAYSRLANRHDFKDLFWRVRLPLLLGGAAIVSALVSSGPFLIRVLYDQRYRDAGWILQYLSAAAWFQILEVTNGAALLATGHVRWVAAGSAAKVAGMAVLIPLGYRFGGFEGALMGLAVSEVMKYATSAWGATAAGLRGVGKDVLLSAVVAGLAATSLMVGHWTGARASSALVGFAASAGCAAVPWAAAVLWYLRSERRRSTALGGTVSPPAAP